MSLRVFAADANPCVDSFLYRQSDLRGQELVETGRAMFVQLADGRRAVQLLPTREEKAERAVGANNLIPFGRVYNPLMQPPSLHYEIPMAGDKGIFARHRRHLIKVSARKIDFTAAAYMTPARVLSNSKSGLSSLDSQVQQFA
jgi:hypothetical protein